MRLIMNDGNLQTVEQVRQFLEGSEAVEFRGLTVKEKYCWIEKVLIRFKYHLLTRDEKGVIRRYIKKVTGYSRSQVSRLLAEYKRTGRLQKQEYRRHRFPRRYALSEIELLARTDELHGWLSGPATKKIMEREYEVYGHTGFGNISRISIAHPSNGRTIYEKVTHTGIQPGDLSKQNQMYPGLASGRSQIQRGSLVIFG